MNLWLLDLNRRQRRAATATAPVVFIEAGAGCGKTRTLVSRIAELVGERGVAPDEILAVVFTRSACAELRERLRVFMGDLGELVNISTFHAWALKALRDLGVVGPRVSVASEGEELGCLQSLFDGAAARPEARKTCMRDVRKIASIYASHGFGHALSKLWREDDDGDTDHMWGVWMDRLARQYRVPYSRLLPDVEREILAGKDVPRYRHVLVDEAHDCTPLEWALGFELARESTTWVLDPRQAIFGWRGGMSSLDFQHVGRERSESAVRVHLQKSYRFGKELAEHANDVARCTVADGVVVHPVRGGAPWETTVRFEPWKGDAQLYQRVTGLRSEYGPGNVAVLCRTNHRADHVATVMGPLGMRAGGKLDPLLAAAIATARLGLNPHDNTTFYELAKQALPEEEMMRYGAEAGERHAAFHVYKARASEPERPRLLDVVPTPDEAKRMRLEDLMKRIQTVFRPDLVGGPTLMPRGISLSMLGLPLPDAIDAMMDAAYEQTRGLLAARATGLVPISTIHSAKGMEWDAVVVLIDAHWPPPELSESEEHRCYYVAVTRARKALVVMGEEERWASR